MQKAKPLFFDFFGLSSSQCVWIDRILRMRESYGESEIRKEKRGKKRKKEGKQNAKKEEKQNEKKEEKQNEKRGKAKFSENPFFWDLVPRFSSSQCGVDRSNEKIIWFNKISKRQ